MKWQKNYNVTEQGGMDSDTKDVNSEVINISWINEDVRDRSFLGSFVLRFDEVFPQFCHVLYPKKMQ